MTAIKKMRGAAPAPPRMPLPSTRTVFDFMLAHGRLPKLGDPEAPWTFKGWALPYVQQIHATVGPDRWGFLLRTMEAGHLLHEPIPQINFGKPDTTVYGALDKWTSLICWGAGGWADFRMLIDWFSWSLGLCADPPHIDDQVNERLYRTVNLGPMLAAPHDYLGQFLCERFSHHNGGFYPTPHSICELMVRMTMNDHEKDGRETRAITACDPCVGSGRMLLHASNFSLGLYGQDIDPLLCAICKINGALYAPWIVCPLPGEVLGSPVPLPPPAPLPVPEEHQTPEGMPVYRADDRGQLLLFNPEM